VGWDTDSSPTYLCGETTLKGTPCRHRLRYPGPCWQHRGASAPRITRERRSWACGELTLKGTLCRHRVREPGPCWQHRGTSMPDAAAQRGSGVGGAVIRVLERSEPRREAVSRKIGITQDYDLVVKFEEDILALESSKILGKVVLSYVSDETRQELKRSWDASFCRFLAIAARQILEFKNYLHKKVADVAEIVLTEEDTPPIVKRLVRELAVKLPLPTDHDLQGFARALQFGGIYLCFVCGRDMTKCPCAIELGVDKFKGIAKGKLIDLAKVILSGGYKAPRSEDLHLKLAQS
jgi:hypothetical protein